MFGFHKQQYDSVRHKERPLYLQQRSVRRKTTWLVQRSQLKLTTLWNCV